MFKALAFLPLISGSFLTTPQALEASLGNTDKFIRNTDSDILLDVPFTHQVNDLIGTSDLWAGGSACGPASLTMVLKDKGKTYDLQTVMNRLPGSVYVKGSMFYDLAAGPKLFGFKANTIEINTNEIYETLKEGNPIIMNIQNYDGITGHAIVIVGIKDFDGANASSLIAHDPFKGPYKTFEYINETTLEQESGWITPIGIMKPFYITKYSLADSIAVR